MDEHIPFDPREEEWVEIRFAKRDYSSEYEKDARKSRIIIACRCH